MTETQAPTNEQVESLLAEIADEFRDRLRRGEQPEIEEYARQYPALADVLRQVLPALQVLRADGTAHDVSGENLVGCLGDFRILREVGRGGMGVVYEAEQVSLGRRVALKVLPFAGALDAKHLQRFKNEAKAAASLRHEHIVQVHAIGCERGVHFYAMEFIEGQTLAQIICGRAGGVNPLVTESSGATGPYQGVDTTRSPSAPTAPVAALSTQRGGPDEPDFHRHAAALIADAADALEHAHSMGIVHRDVKPGNLLLDSAGKVYVSDFGLARFGSDAGLTMSGDLLGTLRYMAPEQALARHGLADHRVDVYGLGCTLYELLTGKPAVGGTDKAEMVRHIAFEEPVAPRKLDKAIPAEMETIALKCLAKNPNERYATAGELAADLRRWLDDAPIKAKPPGLSQRTARWTRRHVAAVRAAVAVVFVVVAALAALAGLAWHKNRQLAAAYSAEATARQIAESGQRLARRALDELSSEVIDDWLTKQPKLSDAQQAFLRRVLAHYDELAVDGSNADETRAAVASAHQRVGTIHYMLGHLADAERAYGKSVDLYEKLIVDFPNARGYRTQLADAFNHLGAAFHRNGRLAESIECARRMIALREQAGDTASPDGRRDLVKAYTNLGRSLGKIHRADEAIVSHRKALAILNQFTEGERNEPAAQKWRAANLQDLGLNLAEKHENEEAERCYRKAIAIYKKLIGEHPGEGQYMADLADAYSALGIVLARVGRPEEMETVIHQGLALLKQRADDFPGVPSYRLEEAIGYYHLALVLKPFGRLPDREKAFLKAIELAEPVWATNRQLIKCRDLLCDTHNNLAVLYVRTDRPARAATSYERALALLEEATAEPGGSPVDLLKRARLYDALGCTQHDLGRLDDAGRSFRSSIDLLSRLAVEAPDDADCHSSLAFMLADCPDPALRDPARAVGEGMKAVELRPAKGDHWSDLGVARYRAGDSAGAVAALHQALERRPGEATEWFFLAMAHAKLGQKDDARRNYEKALAWLAKHGPPDPEVRRYRAEAESLLGIKEGAAKPPETKPGTKP